MPPKKSFIIACCAIKNLMSLSLAVWKGSGRKSIRSNRVFVSAAIAKLSSMSNNAFSREEVSNHDSVEKGLWVIVDSYTLDLTSFIQHHPGSAQKIIRRRNKSVDVSSNFLDHFGHTVCTFREDCKQYDQEKTAVVMKFPEDSGEVFIIGKVNPNVEESHTR